MADMAFVMGDLNYRMEGSFDSLVSQMGKIVELRSQYD